jgi:hypothetical protein
VILIGAIFLGNVAGLTEIRAEEIGSLANLKGNFTTASSEYRVCSQLQGKTIVHNSRDEVLLSHKCSLNVVLSPVQYFLFDTFLFIINRPVMIPSLSLGTRTLRTVYIEEILDISKQKSIYCAEEPKQNVLLFVNQHSGKIYKIYATGMILEMDRMDLSKESIVVKQILQLEHDVKHIIAHRSKIMMTYESPVLKNLQNTHCIYDIETNLVVDFVFDQPEILPWTFIGSTVYFAKYRRGTIVAFDLTTNTKLFETEKHTDLQEIKNIQSVVSVLLVGTEKKLCVVSQMGIVLQAIAFTKETKVAFFQDGILLLSETLYRVSQRSTLSFSKCDGVCNVFFQFR